MRSLENMITTEVPEGGVTSVSGTCEAHGDFTVKAFWLFGKLRNEIPHCPTCMEIEKEKEERDRIQQEREKRWSNLRKKSGLSPRFYDSRFSTYEADSEAAKANLKTCRDFADNWRESYEKGSCLILTGKPGTGKTHLMSALMNQIIVQHFASPVYVTAANMLRHVRSAYGNDQLTEEEAISCFTRADLLVIDEVGTKVASDHDKATLFEIVDERYQCVLPTIMITNLTVDQVASKIDERMIDRLADNGTFMAFNWESYRGRND